MACSVKASEHINQYWPNDYSPFYIIKSDGNGNFIDVIDVYDMEPWYGGKSIKEKMYTKSVEYFNDPEAWKKCIDHFEYIGKKL